MYIFHFWRIDNDHDVMMFGGTWNSRLGWAVHLSPGWLIDIVIVNICMKVVVVGRFVISWPESAKTGFIPFDGEGSWSDVL